MTQKRRSEPKKYDDIIEGNPELRAYIYQQLSDIESMLPAGTGIQVAVHKEEKPKGKFLTVIYVDSLLGQIKALGQAKNLYDSIAGAKEKMLQMMLSSPQVSDDERSARIDEILRAGNKLH